MTYKFNELQAVNIMLSNVGQSPVTSLDSANPAVSLAAGILSEVNQGFQAEGWTFNSDKNYPFMPDVNGYIYVADNIISIDTQWQDENSAVIREGKLYNRRTHSYKWDKKQELDVVRLLDFVDLPIPAK